MQKVIIHLEVPDSVPAQDVAAQVSEALIDTLGGAILTMRVSSEDETLVL